MPGKQVLTAIVYLRVSTGDQARKGYSIPEQRRECLAKAQEIARGRGAELRVYEFVDPVGGDWLERPELDRAREFLRRHRVDLFVCMDPDRFSRNLTHQLLIDEEIRRRGTEPVYVSGSYADTPEGRLFYAVRGAISEFEKAKILERTSRGKRGKVAAGGIPHQFRAYGYHYIKGIRADSPNLCPLEIVEEEARWVRQMYLWAAEEGLNPQQIADRLTALGVPTPRGRSRWQRSTVTDILRNTVYYGQAALHKVDAKGIQALRQFPREWRRARYEALLAEGKHEEARSLLLTFRRRPKEEWQYVPVPAIVDKPLWDRVQQALDRHAKQRSGLDERELSGFGVCGLCGAPIHYGLRNSKGRLYLVCANANRPVRDPRKCSLPRKQARLVHEAVWQEVVAWILEPGRLEAIVTEITGTPPETQNPCLSAEVVALQDQLAAKQEERDRWLQLFARGRIDEDRLDAALQEVDGHIAAIRERLAAINRRAEAERPRRLAAGVLDTIAKLREQAEHVLRNASPTRRREIYGDLLGRFILHPSPPGRLLVTCEPRME